ncbi:hypothetical protein dqs_1959 [Azoarcus olearius]|uniref:hypothetical protein n=1 Tax=Azoarcus sp. (strain BH72) TaxID=418699 RepID=UPI00080631F4|nr:hypothetical protein [Azoarcus olearius]ANQ84997.1 hypothetical protein dqs_1959 [Azoarcus olearius]
MKPADCLSILRRALWRAALLMRRGADTEVDLYAEMSRGAIVGCVAAALIALEFPAAGMVGMAMAGFCIGSVIGLLLFTSTAVLPEDPVLPPAPGQERIRPACRGLRFQRIRSR